MREELHSSLGFYKPSFFKMQVNLPTDLENLNELEDVPSAIYLHEYIHFLQDITTTFGFTNISTVVDYIKYVNGDILKSPTKTFKVPVEPRPCIENEVSFNLKLKKEYLGSQNDVKTADIVSVRSDPKTVTLKTGNVELKNVLIDYKDITGKIHSHHFGGLCVIESMAHLVETSIYPDALPSHLTPDFPYKSAQKLVEQVYNPLLQNPLNILALCDMSLGVFNPGEFFYSILLKMKEEGYLPTSPEEVYRYCYSNLSFQFHGASNFNELLLMTSSMANCQLGEYFTTSIFGDTKTWISYTIAAAVNIRITNPFFILDIARSGKIQSNIPFINIFKAIGTPMVTNLNHDSTFYSPLETTHDIKIQYLWAINQIFRLYVKRLAENERKCEMKFWCKESCHVKGEADYTNEHCINSPWLRTSDEQLCAFATMWKTWGLEGYAPI